MKWQQQQIHEGYNAVDVEVRLDSRDKQTNSVNVVKTFKNKSDNPVIAKMLHLRIPSMDKEELRVP